MTSATLAAAFLLFSGAPLFMLFNISTSFISPAVTAKRVKARIAIKGELTPSLCPHRVGRLSG
jgi:uncharacterized protein (DUF58 family)